jgi:hypothetical protein
MSTRRRPREFRERFPSLAPAQLPREKDEGIMCKTERLKRSPPQAEETSPVFEKYHFILNLMHAK